MATEAGPSASQPDADPSSPPDINGEDADTCRICRGEGTVQEPLFYPCKCSGSIKFVHQECLMEWLSHSQKKHCELCKTPFRFTKLYQPGMPSRIPTSVFLRRAALHVLAMLVTWCRAVLAALVWLVVLPWCMRCVWRLLFWLGDGYWVGTFLADSAERPPRAQLAEHANATTAPPGKPQTYKLMTYSQTLNMSAGEPALFTTLRRFFTGHYFEVEVNHTAAANVTSNVGIRNPSLLSDISFFQLFPSRAANAFVIDVVEGLLITMCVVVALILVFLIREWVVQQQPVMVGHGGDAHPHAVPAPVEDEEDREDEADREDEGHDEEDTDEDEARDDALVYAHNAQPEADTQDGEGGPAHAEHADTPHIGDSSESDHLEPPNDQQRPGMPDRDRSFVATEIRRTLEEGPTWSFADAPQASSEEPRTPQEHQVPESWEDEDPEEGSPTDVVIVTHDQDHRALSDNEQDSELGGENWQQISDTLSAEAASSVAEISQSKGKGKVEESDAGQDRSDHGQSTPPLNSGAVLPNYTVEAEVTQTDPVGSSSVSGPETFELDRPEQSIHQEPQPAPEHPSEHTTMSESSPDSSPTAATTPRKTAIRSRSPSPMRSDSSSSEDQIVFKGRANMPSAQASAIIQPAQEASDHAPEHASEPDHAPEHASEPDQGEQPEQEHAPEQGPAQAPEPVIQAAQPRRPAMDRFWDFLFGDVPPAVPAADDNADDEHIVQNLADEAPFVPFADNEPRPANQRALVEEVADAAAQAGIDINDQEAIDDVEDLEGLMELIGMQGPVTGLFQNALFGTVLISTAISLAVWLPYLWGKGVLVFLGSPILLLVELPIRAIAALADIIVDTSLFLIAALVYLEAVGFRYLVGFFTLGKLSAIMERPSSFVADTARSAAANAFNRLDNLMNNSTLFSHPDNFIRAIDSHAALRAIQNSTNYALNETGNVIISLYESANGNSPSETASSALRYLATSLKGTYDSTLSSTMALGSWIWNAKSYKVTLNFSMGRNIASTYATTEPWSATDRFIAILAGYTFFAVVGALYLKRGSPFSTSRQGRKIEAVIVETLQQAGGVLKVIFIIGIEMIVFPLYCGILLDIALLPLCQDENLLTRWQWTRRSPWTSGFVHWLVGTCYMFHFALFVSMCRKIMRKGVLYFIRDPDDPTFHPVRDVLERSVTTQLRKIAFSALVYGALVIVCLGGVVWGLNRTTTGVLPIHWKSQTPVLEFPLDLLFYNFLTPIIIKLYKPSEGLQTVYRWWFMACARVLRLSNFLFGEKLKDEEGHHVRPTWSSWFFGQKGDPENPVFEDQAEEDKPPVDDDPEADANRVYFAFDGKYVRAPASDQARIPKGETVFVEVDRHNHRKDGKPEQGGVHNSDMVTMVYIPPWFRIRIFAFILAIWAFIAFTGIGITVIPLLFGRYIFSLFLPPYVEINDIHAFSLGVYSLGTFAYSIAQLYRLASKLDGPRYSPLSTLFALIATSSKFALRVVRMSYVWTCLVFLIPLIFALLLELYFLMPLHAYFGPSEPHVVHVIQDWTLGFLYAKLSARILFSDRTSRAARAFAAVIADGITNPNAGLATRYFIVPMLAIITIAAAVPSGIAWSLCNTLWASASAEFKHKIWVFTFPLMGLGVLAVWLGKEGVGMLNKWRMLVRDEVYLVGERLHNFGERRAVGGDDRRGRRNTV